MGRRGKKRIGGSGKKREGEGEGKKGEWEGPVRKEKGREKEIK
jgi:hypothetical protein